jgi:hypothetical protein
MIQRELGDLDRQSILGWSQIFNAIMASARSRRLRPMRLTDGPHTYGASRVPARSMVETGNTVCANWNAAPVNPRPFLLARQGNCARVVRAEIGHARGLVYSLSVRMADFQVGHDAQFRTNQFLREKNGEADRPRSSRNRPDF